MDNRTNTIAGWVLGAGVVFLGAWLITGEIFHSEPPEQKGYPIAGVEEEAEGGKAEQPIAAFLQTADAAKGEAVFAKCTACHNVAPGGASQLGPNLHAIMGAPIGKKPGFAYSEALKAKGGTWTWEAMSAWLANPRTFAPNTKMTFAGLGDPQDRANLMAWLNQQGGTPLPLPAAPAEGADAPGEAAAKASDAPAQGDMGKAQPILNEADVARQPEGRTGGEAAPTAGTSERERR